MSAADAYTPGGKMPLDDLMAKLSRAIGQGPHWVAGGNRLPGTYLGNLAAGIKYDRAFAGLLAYGRSLPPTLQPITRILQVLEAKRRQTQNLTNIHKVYLDAVRLLITVSDDKAVEMLRASAREASHLKGPDVTALHKLVLEAKHAHPPSRESLEHYFDQFITPVDPGEPEILKQAFQRMVEYYHPAPQDGGPAPPPVVDHEGAATGPEPHGDRAGAGGGLVVPGYNYVGPGNPLDNGPPQGPVDEAAKRHDERYDEMLKHGDMPYLHGHGADGMMGKEIAEAEAEGKLTGAVDAVLGNAIRGLWEAKEVANQVADVQLSQVLPPNPPSGSLEPGSLDGEPHSKKPKTSSPDPAPPEQQPAPAVETMTDAAGGGGGVKIKAQWVGGTSFSDSSIVTSHTRVGVLADRGGYVPIHQKGSHDSALQPLLGMKTPYSYIDLNAFSVHLTPRDFQQLIDEYSEIRPKSLTVSLSAIVVKDVSTTSTGTTVSDSGSGGLMAFADDGYEYPYVLGHNQDTLPGHLPGEHYVLPQYGYVTRGREYDTGTDIEVISNHQTELYFLEHHDADCVGTGDTWSHTYDFPSDLPWRKLTTPAQSLYGRHNPVQQSRMAIMTGVDANGVGKWKRPTGMDIGQLPLNYIPGPAIMTPTDQQMKNVNFTAPIAMGNPETGDKYSLAPLVHQPWSLSVDRATAGSVSTKVQSGIGAMAYTGRTHEESYAQYNHETDGSVSKPSLVIQTEGELSAPHLGGAFFVPGHKKVSGQGQSAVFQATMFQEPVFPLLPGAVWDPNPLTYDCQIWTKIPNTECHFFAQYPLLGGWGMTTPPPMIFLRLRQQPGPPDNGAYKVTKSNLNQYAVFNLHYSMEFEVRRRKRSRRHNPEKPAPFPVTDTGRAPYLMANSASDTQTTVYEVPQNQWVARNYSRLL
uniref:Capsid protein 1 n=1 Tax=Rodent tetraparvovirus TaxID=2137541 RepID=A0A2Z3D859_9VIRU|nr:capsid protein 1 [Rodent tetraparvovirus]